MVLHVSREPLVAHKLVGVSELASQAYDRACYLIPGLAATGEAEETQVLAAMVEEQFVRQLPQLRLAFSDLTPRETDRVAKVVADHAGVAKLDVARSSTLSSGDVALAVAIERRLAESLRRDGLLSWTAATSKEVES